MISSMTGFARCEASGAFGALTCELRSVNHRYLESGFRVPDELRALESELRQTLGKELKRGKVDCSVHLRAQSGAQRALLIDHPALQRVLERVREVSAALTAGSASVDVMEVLRWPGVICDEPADNDQLQQTMRELFVRTVAEIRAARSREGSRLRELLEQRCEALAAFVTQVRARLPEVQARVRSRLQERLAELKTQVDADRVEQEIVLMLQRLDVAEELDRLTGHIEETHRVMAAGEPAGRRLDFLMQELNREANTLASKSQDLETTRLTVDMKVCIEQMREQVQNIE